MNKERVLSALGMAAVGAPAIFVGGWFYNVVIMLLVAGAAWELALMARRQGQQVLPALVAGAVSSFLLVHTLWPAQAGHLLTAWVMLLATQYLYAYEKGNMHAASDFLIATGVVVYLGLLGRYLIDLRALPDGLWWFFLVLPTVWLADIGAYLVGRRWGKRNLSPRLSPKKTWEGYWGGVTAGVAWALLVGIYYVGSGRLTLALWQAVLLGLVVAAMAPLGDLTESLFKRQAGVKDSGRVFPGHGGFFDRIDSWLWAAALGYWLIVFLF